MPSIDRKKPESTRDEVVVPMPPLGSFETLQAYVRARQGNRTFGAGELESFERRVLELGRGVVREVIEGELRAADEAAEAIEVGGVSLRRVLRRPPRTSYAPAKGDLIAAVRMARAPEEGKATLKAQVIADVLAILERRPERTRTGAVAAAAEDGAYW